MTTLELLTTTRQRLTTHWCPQAAEGENLCLILTLTDVASPGWMRGNACFMPREFDQALNRLKVLAGTEDLARWNDQAQHVDVLALVDAAIQIEAQTQGMCQ